MELWIFDCYSHTYGAYRRHFYIGGAYQSIQDLVVILLGISQSGFQKDRRRGFARHLVLA